MTKFPCAAYSEEKPPATRDLDLILPGESRCAWQCFWKNDGFADAFRVRETLFQHRRMPDVDETYKGFATVRMSLNHGKAGDVKQSHDAEVSMQIEPD